jgi:tetratricopeptide (TPR) repeat protein
VRFAADVARLKAALADPGRFDEVRAQALALADAAPDDGWLQAELGGVFDANGWENEACQWYERALGFGVGSFPPDQAPEFFVWYGSTLRNVGRLVEAEACLRGALVTWPRHSALQFFWALSLTSLGRYPEAVLALAEVHSGEWDDSILRYQRAVRSYLDELRSGLGGRADVFVHAS